METQENNTLLVRSDPLPSLFWVAVIVSVLFLVFTPFESPGSFVSVILPRLAVIMGILLLGPLVLTTWTPRPAMFMLGAMLIHFTFLAPTETDQLIAEWVGLVAIALFAKSLVARRWEASKAVTILLIVNCIFVFIQFVATQMQLEYFDFHNLIFPTSEARAGVETFAEGIRVSGLHIEPGTYSTWVALLIVVSRLLKNQFGVIEWVATGSMLVTYSTAGIVYVVILSAWTALDLLKLSNVKSFGALIFIVASFVIGFTSLGLDGYLEERFGVNFSTVKIGGGADDQEWRKEALTNYNNLHSEEKLNGFGHAQDICEGCPFDDFGFLPNTFMRGGILGAIGFVLTTIGLIWTIGVNQTFLILALVGSAKAPTNALAPWLVLFIASETYVDMKMKTRRRRRRRRTKAME